jgi:hypothetical protein
VASIIAAIGASSSVIESSSTEADAEARTYTAPAAIGQRRRETHNSNDDLHLTLTTLPSFRYASWEVMPLIPFHRDIEMSLDDALDRARTST